MVTPCHNCDTPGNPSIVFEALLLTHLHYRYLPQYPLLPIEFIFFVVVFEDGRNVLNRKFVLAKSVEEASFATGTIPNNH